MLIDFTRPEGTLAHLAACARHGTGAVVGTTGLLRRAEGASSPRSRSAIPIVFAPNMSVGVNVLLALVEAAARRLGPGYDIEIVEMHHRHKVDAPSGTALASRRGGGARARAARSRDCAVYAREGVTGERKPGTIGFATLRGGDVVGEHTVIFAGAGERDRARAQGDVAAELRGRRAARRALRRRAPRRGRKPGLADMRDVLGLG